MTPTQRSRSRGRPIFHTILLLLLHLLSSPSRRGADAAHARRRRVVVPPNSEPRYDRSITSFAPDGRLLQVEYALTASDRGRAACAFIAEGIGGGNNDTATDAVVVAVVATSDDAAARNGGDDEKGGTAPSDAQMALPGGVEETLKVHRIDSHCLLVTSGLSGDGRALASYLRIAAARHRVNHGEPPSIRELANEMGRLQHGLTLSGGRRPLGARGILAGIDPFPARGNGRRTMTRARLYRGEPGGAVDRCIVCAAGMGRDETLDSLLNLYPGIDAEVAEGGVGNGGEGGEESKGGVGGDSDATHLKELVVDVGRAALRGALPFSGVDGKMTAMAAESRGRNRRTEEWKGSGATIDLYIIRPEIHDGGGSESSTNRRIVRRGGAWIRCARAVGIDDIETAAKLLCAP